MSTEAFYNGMKETFFSEDKGVLYILVSVYNKLDNHDAISIGTLQTDFYVMNIFAVFPNG